MQTTYTRPQIVASVEMTEILSEAFGGSCSDHESGNHQFGGGSDD